MKTSTLKRCLFVIFPAAMAGTPSAAAAGDWKPGIPRTAYVNLFEWNWNSVARECTNFLGPKGYAAVQVSPPNEHKSAPEWWSRYQPVSYQLNSRSGNREQFRAMVAACRQAGVDVYVDAVINHMGNGSGTGTAGSRFEGNSLSFPGVPFGSQDFHPACTPDYSQRNTVTACWMGRSSTDVGLPDLNTGSEHVKSTIAAYLNDLRSLGVAGFRIDAAKHIRPDELQNILGRVRQPFYVTQEILKDGSYADDLPAYFRIGTVNEFTYGYAMVNAFRNLNGSSLRTLPHQFRTWGFFPSDRATVFVNNHDTERTRCSSWAPGGTCDQLSTYRLNELFLANVFMLGYDYGYPQVMSGYYFNSHDMGPRGTPYNGNERTPANCSSSFEIGKWDCVHRDWRVANMVGFRNYVNGTSVEAWDAASDNRISFRRGHKGFVAINNTADHWQQTFATGLPDNTYCNVTQAETPENGGCPAHSRVRVSAGRATVSIAPHSALALHVGATVNGQPHDLPDFSDRTEQIRNAVVVSDTLTLRGLGESVTLSIREGQYRISGGAWTSRSGRISNGQTLQLRTRAPATDNQTRRVVVTVGTQTIDWSVSTGTPNTGCEADGFCPTGTVTSNPAPASLQAGQTLTLYYKGSLAAGSSVKLHWGINGWTSVSDSIMSRGPNGYWKASITLPATTRELDFAFTDGQTWDNNNRADWKWPVACSGQCGGPVTVTFKVRAETRWGESVYIAGNVPPLGNWSTTADAARKCEPREYPVWTCTINFAQGGAAIEYKYQKLGLGTVWESGANRSYSLPSSAATREDGSFRQ